LKRHASFTGTKFGSGESEGGAGRKRGLGKINSRPARAFSLAREARRQFRSK